MFKAVREVKIGECTANQALKKQPLAWYLKDKKDSSRAEFFVTAFVLCVCMEKHHTSFAWIFVGIISGVESTDIRTMVLDVEIIRVAFDDVVSGNHMGVSKNRGIPKWMVKIRENPIKIDDLGGPPQFLETPIYLIF